MKPNSKMLFGNIFDDKNITPNYLARFTDDVIAKLIKSNSNSEFDAVLIPLQIAIIPLRSELGQVDTSFNSQVSKTDTVNRFILDFGDYMKSSYVFIATALGGEKTPEFKEFYPKGKTEYTNISKTRMETLMDRLKSISTTYEAELGPTISERLQSFQSEWTNLRSNQLQQKSALKINRYQRTIARRNVEMSLLKTIYFVAGKYTADESKCKMFFDFHLLFGTHKKHAVSMEPEVS